MPLEPVQTEELDKNSTWTAFVHDFLETPGIHLLGVGQTYSGKTQKAYQITAYLMDTETILWIDSGKSDEIKPVLDLAQEKEKSVRIIIPKGCKMSVSHPELADIELLHAPGPRRIPLMIRAGAVNILSISQYFYRTQVYAKYMSEFMNALIYHAKLRKLPDRVSIICDEFGTICPGTDLQKLSKSFGKTASLVGFSLKHLRSVGIRFVAFDQAYTDIYSPARRQFPFLLICRSPGIPRNAGILGNYSFERLAIDEGYLVFPSRQWRGKWEFNYFPQNKKCKILCDGIADYKSNMKELEDEEFEADL